MTHKVHKNTNRGFTLVEIMIVVVIIGLLAAMAIPAFQQVRTTSQMNAIENNMRQLAQGADQYFLEEGKTVVDVVDLVGTDNYVKDLTPVAQESYPAAVSAGAGIVVTGTPEGDITLDM